MSGSEEMKLAMYRRLVDRVVRGPGRTSAELRAGAFAGERLPDAVSVLVEKVAVRSHQVADADFANALDAGFSEDQLFELVVCAAVGEATRQYEAALAALDDASNTAGG